MPYTQQKGKCITLKGSAAMVRQYLEYGMSNVLYQRGACPPEDFEQTRYYGLNLFKARNQRHVDYFADVLGQIENFLTEKEVKSVILVLMNKNTKEYLERWEFEVDYEHKKEMRVSYGTKDPQMIQNEISAVIRQILGATSILPLLDEGKVTFQIQATQRPGVPRWPGWTRCEDDQTIRNKQEMQFRSFSTSIHGIQSKVEYRGS